MTNKLLPIYLEVLYNVLIENGFISDSQQAFCVCIRRNTNVH